MNYVRLLTVLAAAAVLAAPLAAHAQQYPQKPVRVIVTTPAGQGTDIITRMYTARLASALGQSFFVENRAGAGGTIGTASVAKAPPDGYTLLIGTAATHGISVALFDKLEYDPVKDFIPIGLLGGVPMAIAVRPDLGIATLADLIARSKSQPINIALPSPMASLVREMLVKRSEAGLTAVPYKGSAAAVNDVLGGHINVIVDTSSAVQAQANAGKLLALAITTPRPSNLMPGIKTVAEQGFPGFEVVGWFMLFAPKGTPAAIVNTLNVEMQKIGGDPEMQKLFVSRGFDPIPVGEPAQLNEFVKNEYERWVKISKEINLRTN